MATSGTTLALTNQLSGRASVVALFAAQGHNLTDDWSLPVPISLTADAHFGARLGAFF